MFNLISGANFMELFGSIYNIKTKIWGILYGKMVIFQSFSTVKTFISIKIFFLVKCTNFGVSEGENQARKNLSLENIYLVAKCKKVIFQLFALQTYDFFWLNFSPWHTKISTYYQEKYFYRDE